MQGIPSFTSDPKIMSKVMIIFCAVFVLGVFIMDSIIFINFSKDSDIVLHSPVDGSTNPLSFRVMGYAWDKESIIKNQDIKVEIQLKRKGDGNLLSFPAARSKVRRGSQVLFNLAAYSSHVTLPETEKAGRWLISARMTTVSGYIRETAPREILIDPQAPSREFIFFSFEHLSALVLLTVCFVIIVLMFRNNRNRHLVIPVSFVLFGILWINEIIYRLYWVKLSAWSPSNALMLQMCGLALLMIPFALFIWQPKLRLYLTEIIFFWGLGGCVQALLTPDIGPHGFPEFKFFAFFISHGFIIVTALFLISAYNIRITISSYIRAVVITNIMVAASFLINHVLSYFPPFEPANYFVVGYPPPDGSVVDLFVEIFGPSPWYVIGLEIMGLVVFALLCVPFMFMKKKSMAH
jgi:hypothetical integral membrane protein (TIGR02206 family)